MLDGRWLLPTGLDAVSAFIAALVLAALHETHGHGPPSFFNNTERSFSAGPNFMFSWCIKWSSVSKGKPDPSMHCSRKFWKKDKNKHVKLSFSMRMVKRQAGQIYRVYEFIQTLNRKTDLLAACAWAHIFLTWRMHYVCRKLCGVSRNKFAARRKKSTAQNE